MDKWGSSCLGFVGLVVTQAYLWYVQSGCIRLRSLWQPMPSPQMGTSTYAPDILSSHGLPSQLSPQSFSASLPCPTFSYQKIIRNRFACKARVVSRGWWSVRINHFASCHLKSTSNVPFWVPQKRTVLLCRSLRSWVRHFLWPIVWRRDRDCEECLNIVLWT